MKYIIINRKIACILSLGPIILGEGAKEGLPSNHKFLASGKEAMLDDYREMNRKAADKQGATYIDLRKYFLAITKSVKHFKGNITQLMIEANHTPQPTY